MRSKTVTELQGDTDKFPTTNAKVSTRLSAADQMKTRGDREQTTAPPAAGSEQLQGMPPAPAVPSLQVPTEHVTGQSTSRATKQTPANEKD